MSPIERAARALCEAEGREPDKLEPGNCPHSDDREIIDGECANGDPGFFVWRLYEDQVRAVLQAIREPGPEALLAGGKVLEYVRAGSILSEQANNVWQAMIDTALTE